MRRIIGVAFVGLVVLAVAAQSAFAFFDESAFIATTDYTQRSAFIIDQGPVVQPPSQIPGSVFLTQPYLSYYAQFGFDRNFFTWLDSNGSFSPNKKLTWSGCTPVDPGAPVHQTKQVDGRLLCDPAFTVTDDQGVTIRSLITNGPVHGFVYTDPSGVVHYV